MPFTCIQFRTRPILSLASKKDRSLQSVNRAIAQLTGVSTQESTYLQTRVSTLVQGNTMSITTTSSLPAPVQQSFSYKLLSVPVPNMIHKIPAMRKNMPRNGGTTLRMRRYNPLNTAMVPLGNSGITPPPQNLTAVDIDAKISFYGKGAVTVH